jgi:hypothetical protein
VGQSYGGTSRPTYLSDGMRPVGLYISGKPKKQLDDLYPAHRDVDDPRLMPEVQWSRHVHD